MLTMKKNKFVLLFLCIFLVLTALVFIISFKDKIPDNIFSFVDIGTHMMPRSSVEVNSLNSYGQSFVSNFDNLYRMSIFIPSQDLNRRGELTFHLKNNKTDNEDLVTLKWKFNQIKFEEKSFYVIPPDRESSDEGFHFHFNFPVISESKNKKFYFFFESPDTKEGGGIKLGIWDRFNYYEGLSGGRAFINHRPIDGFLAFRTYNTWRGNLKKVFSRISARFKTDILFTLVYGCLLSIVLLGIIITGIRSKRNAGVRQEG